jgi:1-acyl-sn-glycerol-3-phosphate acyltransferase
MESYRYLFPYNVDLPDIRHFAGPSLGFHLLVEKGLILLAKLLSGVQVEWINNAPTSMPRVYIANHTSHLDFLLIWSALPGKLREITSAVVAKDYWEKVKLRRYFVTKVFNTVRIARRNVTRKNNMVDALLKALKQQLSLIIFPEGTRSRNGEMGTFKSGIYYLAKKMPQIEFVPVYLENANRVLPKGEIWPIPILCSVIFGRPFRFDSGLSKHDFLTRAKTAVEKLKQ